MNEMSLAQIAAACCGTYIGAEAEKTVSVTGVVIDSRQVEPGNLYIPIRGERVDGHKFISDVFAKGAAAVLSEEKLKQPAGPYILVDSSEQALKDIAEYYRSTLPIRIVGITGSVGKTSTKEMIAAVLAQKYRVLKTEGNLNNEIGLPLTILKIREEHEVAVIEMGISEFGEMHRLAKVARPDVCVLTNIGQCHLEFLKNRDGVLRAKTEIFDFMKEDGSIVLNGDDDKLAQIQEAKGIRPIFFGTESGRSVYADHIENLGLKGVQCRIHVDDKSVSVRIPIPGHHMVMNALAAAAVGHQLGLTMEEIKAGIEQLEAVSGRFHIIENGRLQIIDDCYNANPVSMKASLDVLCDAKGRRVAILGDMGELGENEAQLHAEVGAHASGNHIDLLICTGTVSSHMAEAAVADGGCGEVLQVPTLDALLTCLPSLIEPDDTVLVKASHFMHFEKVVEKLEKLSWDDAK